MSVYFHNTKRKIVRYSGGADSQFSHKCKPVKKCDFYSPLLQLLLLLKYKNIHHLAKVSLLSMIAHISVFSPFKCNVKWVCTVYENYVCAFLCETKEQSACAIIKHTRLLSFDSKRWKPSSHNTHFCNSIKYNLKKMLHVYFILAN